MNPHREHFALVVERVRQRGPSDETVELLTLMEVVMEAIDGIQAEFDDYKATVTSAFAAVDQALSDFAARVTELSTELQNAGLDPAKATALANDITSAQQAAQSELSKVQAADPGAAAAPAAAPAADPAAAPSPVAPADTGSAAPDPSAAGVAAPASPAAPATGEMPVYTFDGDPSTVNASAWTTSGQETTDNPPKLLYYFASDQAGQPPQGDGADGGQWHVYTGPSQPVPTT